MAGEQQIFQRDIDWHQLIEEALAAPGDLQGVYDRFYNYSFLNMLYLRMQGVAEPVASAKRWRAIGRTILSHARPKEIICPVIVNRENEEGVPQPVLVGFKPVRCIYTLSETEGPEPTPLDLPDWDAERALTQLRIRRVPFTELNSNIQGYSQGRDLALNPVAVHPTRTLAHEMGHIVLGHTIAPLSDEYVQHRGIAEFEAEATAYLVLNQLQLMDEAQAGVSHAYIQDWLDGGRPPDRSIRRVFGAVDAILRAGRIAVGPVPTSKQK